MSEHQKQIDFDFYEWFLRRFSRHTPAGEPRRRGTFTLSEEQLLKDLVYDFRAVQNGRIREKKHKGSISEKKAKTLCKKAIQTAECLAKDKRGYFLKGELRLRFDAMWRVVADE